MSQEENTELNLEGAGAAGEAAGERQANPAGAAAANQLPPAVLEEIQSLRRANQQLSEERHQTRMALLTQASTPASVDPVETAYKRLEAAADPDAWKYVGPMLKPLLAELASARDLIQQQGSQLEFLTRRDRERETHTQLAQLIPDLDALSPRILQLLQDMPPQVQKMYADNPSLLVPLAKSLREGTPMSGKKAAASAARAAVSMDTGGTADRVIPLTADAIANLNPNSKEFAAMQRQFYGQ